MSTEHFSSEQKILRVMRKVLGSVVKDVTPRDGEDNPLTDNTIEEIRDIFGLISVREKELLETLGRLSADRPQYPGEKPAAKVIPISIGSLKASKKPAESTSPLAQTALFNGVDLDAVEPLLDDCPLYELEAGETLLAAGAKNNHLFLVMGGSLKAELDEARTMNFSAGQCIGEISALGESTMSAPVVAVEASLLLAIDPDTLWAMMDADAVVARNILAMLAHR
ncbi:hypothetical protein SKTS_17890 [Sulfurimicrobium lacus]|uniref:Cyclic nucleotide-binding domain-containing protein n=1 Tax=Sulfurimicrobium lacus TaxID=2715678 RepID=A0A6F8VAN3_9PROT|nr:cyclic nucleotide-binding domain-containing protein [Sulfurimicrobium lacus]BCB26903.1 hypothetical protein SKTS_17890 [Sulfurimicrobium lacus]